MNENKLIDGKKIAADLRAETAVKLEAFKKDYNKVPTLAVVLVGEDPASQVYVKTKTKMAKEIGMDVEDHFLDTSVAETDLLKLISDLNQDDKVLSLIHI